MVGGEGRGGEGKEFGICCVYIAASICADIGLLVSVSNNSQ